jgi:hypothetical protein
MGAQHDKQGSSVSVSVSFEAALTDCVEFDCERDPDKLLDVANANAEPRRNTTQRRALHAIDRSEEL